MRGLLRKRQGKFPWIQLTLSVNRFFNVQQNYGKYMILFRLAERWEKIDVQQYILVEFNLSFKENIFIDVANEIYGHGMFADYLKVIGSVFPALKLARFMIEIKTGIF